MPEARKIAVCACCASFEEDRVDLFFDHINNQHAAPSHQIVWIADWFAEIDYSIKSKPIR